MTSSRVRIGLVLAWVGIVLALGCLVAAALSGPAYRFLGWWSYRTGLTVLRWSAWGALAAAVICLVGLMLGRARGLALVGVLVGVSVFVAPWWFQQQRPAGPGIHDVSTDTADPPRFVAVLPLRKDAANKADYEGSAAAERQHKAYPDIAPALLPVPPSEAFARSLNAAKALGWAIVAAEAGEGRIEATDTTRFFGFKDDIVIRVTRRGAGSRVDVRSVSRVGRSDFGTNARRVRAFLKQLGQ